MKKIAYYIRVSTQEQVNNGFGKDSQLAQLNKYTQYHFNQEDIDGVPLIYSDLGISGGKNENERPGLKKLLKDIEDGIINTVIVGKLDRLARTSIKVAESQNIFLKKIKLLTRELLIVNVKMLENRRVAKIL